MNEFLEKKKGRKMTIDGTFEILVVVLIPSSLFYMTTDWKIVVAIIVLVIVAIILFSYINRCIIEDNRI